MKLYRFVHKDELENMRHENHEALGCYAIKFEKSANRHKYDMSKKYLHFFYNKNACQHMIKLYKNKFKTRPDGTIKDYYIVTFKIPFVKTISHTALGFYQSLTHKSHGYIDYEVIKKRYEVALDADKFDAKWIFKVEPAKDNFELDKILQNTRQPELEK